MRRLLYHVLGMLFLCQSVMAGDGTDAENLLKHNLNAVLAIFQEKDLDQQAKNDRIVETISPMFDFALMSRLVLGRKHWPDLPQEKKERFTELFIKRLKSSYLANFTLYSDERVIYEPAVEVEERIQIPTYLISKDKKISMLYKFFKAEDGWKIYDLEIQGVSLIQSYRSQFNWILEKGTVDDLLLKLETQVEN